MPSASKHMIVLLIMISNWNPISSQVELSPTFYKSLSIDRGWTAISLPANPDMEISRIKVSSGLESKHNVSGQLMVRPVNLSKKIFYLEIPTKFNPVILMLLLRDSEMAVKPDTPIIPEACHFSVEKLIDNKLYITTSTVPDELFVLWNDTRIPNRQSGKSITITLPSFVNIMEKSYVRVFSAIDKKISKEFVIPLHFGRHVPITEIMVGKDWNYVAATKLDSSINSQDVIQPIIVGMDKVESNSFLPNWVNVYCDVYYAYYTDSVGKGQFQQFPGISPRSNTFGLNTAQINFQYATKKIRGSLAFHFGDYAKSTWSSSFNQIMEANIGLRLSKFLWIDGGFFRTHLGTEGLLPRENICSSVSIGTWYEPTYISGIRFNFIPNDTWIFNLYLLNGYNGFEDTNDKKSIGMAISYTINQHGNIGYTNYLGDDTAKDTNSVTHLRFYQNIYFNYQLRKFKLQIGGDFAIQNNSDLEIPTNTASLFSSVGTIHYSIAEKLSTYGRLEFFNDPDAIVSSASIDRNGKLSGYSLWGITAGFEIKPLENIYIRLEGRRLALNSDHQIFRWKEESKSNRTEAMIHMGISF